MQKYSVGDRVICVIGYGEGAVPGDMGTVVKVYEDTDSAPVILWDDHRACRHDANGAVPDGHGWFVYNEHIELCKADDLGEFNPSLTPDSINDLFGG